MAGPSADRITEWEGGSLSELVAMLQAAALPVRIEVIAPGTTGSNAGEVHLLAGGLADAFAGSLRRDDAMSALQRLEGARYVIESRLPNPESGSLSEPGPHQGSLKDRPLASLMRYCEDYVLTCRLEVWRGQDRAVISYRRGEIIGTVVGGSEGSELLPEVLSWTEGAYEIILPAPVLPQMPSRGRDGAKSERKRHSTLPMMTAQEARPEGQGASRTDLGAKIAAVGTAAAASARSGTEQAAQSAVSSSAPRMTSSVPRPAPQSAQPVVSRQLAPSQAAPAEHPARSAQSGPAAQKPAPQHSVPAAATPRPIAVTPRPIAARLAGPLPPEMTERGTPPVPAVPLVPAPAPQPVPRPTMQGAGAPLFPPKLATPAQPKPVASMAQPAAQPKPGPFAVQPVPQPKPAAPAARPAAQAQPKTSLVAPQAGPKPNPPALAVAVSTAVSPAVQPPVQVASQADKPQPVPPRPLKPSPAPAASNDLMPASGTIEAKPKHAGNLPPTTAPIQIADEPRLASLEQPSTPVAVPSLPPKPRRAVARKGVGEHPVRVYVFLGLAIGVGIVLAYGAYWYLPFGHH